MKKRKRNPAALRRANTYLSWGVGLLVVILAAACSTSSSNPVTPTPAIPGPAFVQFFTNP